MTLRKNFPIPFLMLVAFLFLGMSAQAQIRENADGSISAQVDRRIVECYEPQLQSNWCWAASIQTVLHFYGIDCTQREIARKILGMSQNRAVSAKTMVEGLDGWKLGSAILQVYEDLPLDMRRVVKAMHEEHPLIVGLDNRRENHTFVLIGIDFSKDSQQEDKIHPSQVILLDPATPKQPLVRMGWKTFFRRVGMVLHLEYSL